MNQTAGMLGHGQTVEKFKSLKSNTKYKIKK
jgi:hypothetical protein